jgi:hypothetical protein
MKYCSFDEKIPFLSKVITFHQEGKLIFFSLADEAVEHNFEIVEILNVSENISRFVTLPRIS